MRTFTVKRDGDVSLVFDGVLLGSGSSRRPDSDRWFDVEIFKTVGGTYVVAGAGRSCLPGERDRCWAVTCTAPHEVVRAVTRRDDEGVEFITRTASDALEQASRIDEAVRDAFLKRVA